MRGFFGRLGSTIDAILAGRGATPVAEGAGTQLRHTEEQLAFTLKSARLGSWDLDLSTGVLAASDICRETYGWPAKPAYTMDDLISCIHPDDRKHRDDEVTKAVEQHTDLDVEYRVIHPDGALVWVQIRGRAEYGDDGQPTRFAGISLDITERKKADERQRLLLDELNHRVKNTLATVQSIAMQTQRTAKTPEAFGAALDSRVQALADAHDLLTRTNWNGASLADVVALTLNPYAAPGEGATRVRVSGELVTLAPNAAVTLNMAFHELATNAFKYGSLSVPDGQVDVTWSVDRVGHPATLAIDWRESGGPDVTEPVQRGFGSRLLQQGLARELGGTVTLGFEPGGLYCRMRLPLSPKIYAAH